MWTILLEVPVTRRKTMSFVLDEEKAIVYSAMAVEDAFNFCHGEAQLAISVIIGHHHWEMLFKRPLTQKERESWLKPPLPY